MPKSTGKNWMGVPEVCEYLGIVQHTVYKLIHNDEIRASKIGRVIRLRKADVDAYLERRLAVGEGWDEHDLVFCGPVGEPLNPESVAKVFDRRVARSTVKRIRFHDLRHTHVAHLIAAGQDALVISKRLGHASVSFTYDRYGHLMPKADSDAASAVAALVDGGLG